MTKRKWITIDDDDDLHDGIFGRHDVDRDLVRPIHHDGNVDPNPNRNPSRTTRITSRRRMRNTSGVSSHGGHISYRVLDDQYDLEAVLVVEWKLLLYSEALSPTRREIFH